MSTVNLYVIYQYLKRFFRINVAFHVEPSHLCNLKDWFLYGMQHWAEMC